MLFRWFFVGFSCGFSQQTAPAIQDEAAPEVPRLRVVVLGASRGSGVPGDPRLGLDVVTRR